MYTCVHVCVSIYLLLLTFPQPHSFPAFQMSDCTGEDVFVGGWVGHCCDVSTGSALKRAILSVQLCMTSGGGV